ncbi:hypothetical protein BsWGS_12397 [Bradybaena similaris]
MASLQAAHAGKRANGPTDVIHLKDQQVRLVPSDNVKMLEAVEKDGSDLFHKGAGRLHKCRRWLKTNLFLLLTFAGIISGLVLGLTVRIASPSPDALLWIGMPGELYMRILQAMILPLIVCTVIDGTANTDPRSNGRIGLVTMTYIMITNTLGVIVGISLCLIIDPASTRADDETVVAPDTRNLRTVDIFADFMRNMFPDNIVAATMQMAQTKYTQKEVLVQTNVSGLVVNTTSVQLARSMGTVPGTNILGLIVLSAAIGIAASQAGEKSRPFIDFFSAGARIIYKLFGWAKWSTPLGVASLIAHALVQVESIRTAFTSMGMFVVTTSGGCLMYQWLVLPVILVAVTRRNPLKFLSHVVKPWMLAFGPATSTIPLPEMIKISQEVYRVDPRVAGFTIPFCVTLNRDGSCLFIAVTCLFVAQYGGTSLSSGDIFVIGTLVTMSSLALPAVPSSAIVAILIILGSMGIPTHSIGLVMAVEWFNDRIRTTTNVVSHNVAALVTWKFCRASLTQSVHEAEVEVFPDKEDV